MAIITWLQHQPRQRLAFGLIALICTGAMLMGLYLQHILGLEPCPLCVLQRICFIGIILLALLAFAHYPGVWGRASYAGLILLCSGSGIAIAGRQVWLQSLPKESVPDCGPGLEFILDAFPLLDALKIVLGGSGECAEVQWVFLGLSIPGWSLVLFSLVSLLTVYILLTNWKK